MTGITYDLSRSFSRLDRETPTGIDRVEWSLFHALCQLGPVNGLIRSGGRYWHGPAHTIQPAFTSQGALQQGSVDLVARMQPWRDMTRRRAESGLRAATGRQGRLRPPVPQRGEWLICAGHSLPADHVVARWRRHGGRFAVLVHDLIPLLHPEWSRPKPAERFAAAMQITAHHADLVLHLTQVGMQRWTSRYGMRAGQANAILPMGETQLPKLPRQPATRPNMLMIGTIEPRKGHRTILDIWDSFADRADLIILGTRGWNNQPVFDRLNRHPAGVVEVNDAPDMEIAQRIATAHCLLFPSMAEGYGLPVMEARARGLPVIASDLPELRELHGDHVNYVTADDPAAWRLAITKSLQEHRPDICRDTVGWASWTHAARILKTHLANR